MTDTAKIVICGLDRAGKTSIIKFIQEGQYMETMRTLGYSIEDLKMKKLNFELHDLGGQEQFRGDWRMHFPGSNAIIWVVDSSAPERFEESKREFDKIKGMVPGNAVLILMANKQDIEDSISSEEIKEFLNLQELGIPVKAFETSAITAEGLKESMRWIYENIKGEKMQKLGYFPPAIHIQDRTYKCIYLQAGECPTPDSVPSSCSNCEYCSCENCLNQVPACLELFEIRN